MPIFSFRSALLFGALVASLAVAPVAPEAGNIIFLLSAGIALACLRAHDRALLAEPVVWMPLLGLLLMVIAFAVASGTAYGALAGGLFAPFLAIPTLIALSRHGELLQPALIGVLGLVGLLGAAAISASDVLLMNMSRGGSSVANPIHFADLALLIGFLCLLGFLGARGVWRLIFLLGLPLSLLAIGFSGTRGAVVAFVAMMGTLMAAALILRIVSWRIAAVFVGAVILTLVVAWFLGLSQLFAIQRVLADLAQVTQMSLPGDESTNLRLSMYSGAWAAFLDAPIFGHGPFAFVEAANARAVPPFGASPHLHNDIADFAASAGLLGLSAYVLFLLAPLAQALRHQHRPQGRAILAIVLIVVVGFFVIGLTNAMIGILNLTVFYAAFGAIIGMLTLRQPAPVGVGTRR